MLWCQTDHTHTFFLDFSVVDKKLTQWENAKRQANCKDHFRETNIQPLTPIAIGYPIWVTWFLFVLFVAQAVRFYGSFNVTVTGITIKSSPQCHLKFDNCIGVSVHDMSVSSPGDSPNTDGIHLQNSKDVLIHSSTLACGNYIPFNFVSSTFIWTHGGDKGGAEYILCSKIYLAQK